MDYQTSQARKEAMSQYRNLTDELNKLNRQIEFEEQAIDHYNEQMHIYDMEKQDDNNRMNDMTKQREENRQRTMAEKKVVLWTEEKADPYALNVAMNNYFTVLQGDLNNLVSYEY